MEEMTKISELNTDQRNHLAWRLDHKTACGLLTACRIARGEMGDLDLVEIFLSVGKSKKSAEAHAALVRNYEIEKWLKKKKR